MRELPPLFSDDIDSIVVDEPTTGRVATSTTVDIRPPAGDPYARFPVTFGFLLGVPTDLIASSLARGDGWRVGHPVMVPRDRFGRLLAMWLSLTGDDVPPGRQVAAWRLSERRRMGP